MSSRSAIVVSLAAALWAAPSFAGPSQPLVFDPNNHAPEWETSTPKEVSANDKESVHFTVRATDADNDPLTYSLSGLPAGAKAEPTEGAVQVSWTPTGDDLGVYHVVATATDGKSKIEREIRITVEEEHESFFMPGVGYSFYLPGNIDAYGVFNGFTIEFLGVRWVHDNDKRGPSHGRIYVDFDVLFSSAKAIDPMFMPLLGFDLSIERNPARRYLIPHFGMEGGALFQKQISTLGFITPFGGIHFYSARNIELGLKVGYMLPFTSAQFGDVAGLRVRASVDVSFW